MTGNKQIIFYLNLIIIYYVTQDDKNIYIKVICKLSYNSIYKMSKESEMIQNFLKEKDIALASLEDDLNDVVCDEIADNDSKISNRITISGRNK